MSTVSAKPSGSGVPNGSHDLKRPSAQAAQAWKRTSQAGKAAEVPHGGGVLN